MWVVVKIMVPFWVLSIIRHLLFRGPKRDHNLDNHPCVSCDSAFHAISGVAGRVAGKLACSGLKGQLLYSSCLDALRPRRPQAGLRLPVKQRLLRVNHDGASVQRACRELPDDACCEHALGLASVSGSTLSGACATRLGC